MSGHAQTGRLRSTKGPSEILTVPRLTAISVKNAKPRAQRYAIPDSDCRWLYLNVHPSGRKSWSVRYRFRGRARNLVLSGSLSLASAREAVLKARTLVAQGIDPAVERPFDARSLEQRVIDKALDFLARDVEPGGYLYRHYHPNGDLLYVGFSLRPLRRQHAHIKAAGWRTMICRILIEPFETREQALAAEEAAIRDEFPSFNTTHNARRHPFQEIQRKDV
jgi:Arm DNA-binding domain